MKFEGSIEINKPREAVVRYFADPAYLHEYQDGFVKKELVNGEMGKDGAVSKMYYRSNKREMELIETITSNKLPDSFKAFYHHKHMDNTMQVRFIAEDENTTRYEYTFEYVRIRWIMPKLMFFLFPGMFRKQGEKWVRQFKEFVEKQP